MTIEQALQILDQAASRAMLPREDHYKVQVAVETIREEFEKMRKEGEKPSTNPQGDMKKRMVKDHDIKD
jgi:hypothetical protein